MIHRGSFHVSLLALGALFVTYVVGQGVFAALLQFADAAVNLAALFGAGFALLCLCTAVLVWAKGLRLAGIGFQGADPQWIALAPALAALALLVVSVLGLLISEAGRDALNQYTGGQVAHTTGLQFALTLITLGVLAPLMEEFLFRGVLFTALRERLGLLIAILGSSVLFAIFHSSTLAVLDRVIDQLLVIASLSSVGLIAVWLRHVSGSLYPAILMHGAYNTLVFIVQILSP